MSDYTIHHEIYRGKLDPSQIHFSDNWEEVNCAICLFFYRNEIEKEQTCPLQLNK